MIRAIKKFIFKVFLYTHPTEDEDITTIKDLRWAYGIKENSKQVLSINTSPKFDTEIYEPPIIEDLIKQLGYGDSITLWRSGNGKELNISLSTSEGKDIRNIVWEDAYWKTAETIEAMLRDSLRSA